MAAWIEASLKFIPAGGLDRHPTLLPVLLPHEATGHLSLSNPYLVSAAAAVARRILTRNLMATIAIGLSSFLPIAFSFFNFTD